MCPGTFGSETGPEFPSTPEGWEEISQAFFANPWVMRPAKKMTPPQRERGWRTKCGILLARLFF